MAQEFDADSMLAFIGQLGKEVDNLKTKIAGLNEAGGKGTNNLTNEFARFGQTVERYTRGPIKAMDAAVAGLAKTLAGAGGLTLSFAGVAKALDQFAVGELRVRNFATNTGFSIGAIKDMRVQLAAAGIDAGEAAGGIGSIGSKLQEVLALQETSGFYRTLQASSPALAEQVRQLMNMGRQQEAMNVLQKAYNEGGERFKAWLPTATGLSRAAFEAGRYGMEGLIKPWKFNEQEAAKYHKTMTNLETIGTGVWTSMAFTMIEGINKMMGAEGIDGLNTKAREFAEGFKSFFNSYVMPTLETTRREFGFVVDAFKAVDTFFTKWSGIKKEGEPKDEKDKLINLRTERAIIGSMNEQLPGGPEGGKASQGIWEWFKNQFNTEAHAGEYEPGSALLEQKQSEEMEKDSNKSLRDMRDVFIKWDQSEGEAGGGGRAGGSGFAGSDVPGGRTGAAIGGAQGPMGRSGPSLAPGTSSASGPETTADLGEGKEGSEYLAARRAPMKQQIENDPALKRQVAALMTMEHESDPAAVYESLANRMDYVNTERAKRGQEPLSLKQMVFGTGKGSFYGPVRRGLLGARMAQMSPERFQAMYNAMAFVHGGSNLLEGATDQGSANDPNAQHQGGRKVRFGEVYNDFGGGPGGHAAAARFREMIQKGFREGVKSGIWTAGTKAIPHAALSRDAIDSSLRVGPNDRYGTATVDIDFSGMDKAKKEKSRIDQAFLDVKVHRSPQAPVAGGGVTAFNTYAFE